MNSLRFLRSCLIASICISYGFGLAIGPAYSAQRVGDFFVSSNEKRFGDGSGWKAENVAGNGGFLIECAPETGRWKILLAPARSDQDLNDQEKLSIRVTIDDKPAFETIGTKQMPAWFKDYRPEDLLPLNWHATLDDPEPTLDSLAGAKKISFHIIERSGRTVDMSFATGGSMEVIDLLRRKGCRATASSQTEKLPEAADWSGGVWPPNAQHTSGGLQFVNSENYVEITCLATGELRMFATKRGTGEEADYSEPSIQYSIDGKLFAMSGKAWGDGGRIDFDEPTIQSFLDRLKVAKSVFAFAVGIKKDMSFIDVSPGYVQRDIEQLEAHCPPAEK